MNETENAPVIFFDVFVDQNALAVVSARTYSSPVQEATFENPEVSGCRNQIQLRKTAIAFSM